MLSKLLIITSLLASIVLASDITVQGAYVRAVPPMMHTSAAYMDIVNTGDKDKTLVRINTSVAKMAQLHKTVMSNKITKMMKMIPIKSLVIPKNGHVKFKPGGYHVMLIGLNKKLKPKENVNFITLHFSDNTSITIKNIPVKSIMSNMKMKM